MSKLNELSNSDQKNISIDEDLQEFMQLTEANRTVALEYLNKHSWNVVAAINDFFEVMYQENANKEDDNDKLCEKYMRRNSKLFCVLSYNIDSISSKNLKIRIEAVCDIILEELATIVLLQEVTEESEKIIRDKLSTQYEIYSGNFGLAEYYIITLIRKQEWIKFKDYNVINFDETQMGRNILQVNVVIHNVELHFFNTHLESTKSSENIRKRQLMKFFSLFDKNSTFLKTSPVTLIGGGDMNLRDSELNSIGGPPIGVEDAWVATGSNKILEYTWDAMRNDNLDLINEKSRFKPRMRFDRIYIRHSQPTSLGIIHFGLVGLKRLKPYVCFPSDHWGLITVYEINPDLKSLK